MNFVYLSKQIKYFIMTFDNNLLNTLTINELKYIQLYIAKLIIDKKEGCVSIPPNAIITTKSKSINTKSINTNSKDITIYTDGSYFSNDGSAGIGVFFGDDDERNVSMALNSSKMKVTNQVAELVACIKALEIIDTEDREYDSITIVSDSGYTINSMTKWIKNWIKKGWRSSTGKPVKNLALMKKLYKLTQKHNVTYRHVYSHGKNKHNDESEEYKNDEYGNDQADDLATKCH